MKRSIPQIQVDFGFHLAQWRKSPAKGVGFGLSRPLERPEQWPGVIARVWIICCVVFAIDLQSAAAVTGGPPVTAPPTKNAASWTDFGPMHAYVDGTGWFSLDVPARWSIQDESNDFSRMIRIMDPIHGATLFVRTQVLDANVDVKQSDSLLRAVIGMRFAGGKGLVRNGVHSSKDGGRTMQFSYDAVVENRTVAFRGESVIREHGNAYLSILAFAAPATVFEDMRVPMVAMMGTYVTHPVALDPNKLIIENLWRYRHPGGLFEVNVPAHWLASDESTPGQVTVKFYDPAGRAGMVVEIARASPGISLKSAQVILLGNVHEHYGQMGRFRMLSSRELSNGVADATFGYQGELRGAPVPMLGWSLLRREQGVVGTLRVLVPHATASRLWTHVIDIGAGFMIDPTAPLP